MMKYQLSLRDETIVEKEFWRSINTLNKDIPMYGADQVGSIFKDQFANGWNVAKLDTILRIGLPEDMPGITRPMLYFGQYRAMFSWHKEDFDLKLRKMKYGKRSLVATLIQIDNDEILFQSGEEKMILNFVDLDLCRLKPNFEELMRINK